MGIINVPISEDDRQALTRLAERDYRMIRDQAAWYLRQAIERERQVLEQRGPADRRDAPAGTRP